jgi:small subunit ribosomal protein S17
LKGTVVSAKMQGTVIVKVDVIKVHPKYHKRYTVSKKYPAHIEGGEIKQGDKVLIEETRPVSKTVHWKVISQQ